MGLVGQADVVGIHPGTQQQLLIFKSMDGLAAAKARDFLL
jgi:hypothetical protein